MLDFTNVEVSNDFELIKKGHYKMTCTDWKEKETQDGKSYYSAQFTLFGEQYDGRIIFENFFITDKFSEKAAQIGMGKIKSFLEATKTPLKFDSYEQLFNEMLDKSAYGVVGISKSKDPQYEDKNTIYRFYEITESVAVGENEVPF